MRDEYQYGIRRAMQDVESMKRLSRIDAQKIGASGYAGYADAMEVAEKAIKSMIDQEKEKVHGTVRSQ